MSAARELAIDARRVIADLRELQRRTADAHGAQRLCWGPGWLEARSYLRELLGELGVELELDEAANGWARLAGREPGPALALGSHLDSVPNGGWLDGALGVMAAVGVLRAHAAAGGPPRDLVLVDWADEEGARFGRSLLGSSAFSGSLDPAELDALTDADGRRAVDVLAEHDVDPARMRECGRRRDRLAAYLELHIEQGPRMEADGTRAAAVSGCAGVERLRFTFTGQASHAGTTPMDMRRDAGLAAAATALAVREIPAEEGGVATTGELELTPGIVTAVAGEARLAVDLRNPDAQALARMLERARAGAARAAEAHGCALSEAPVWRIEPIPFDSRLVTAAREACAAVTGKPAELASGALHDAAEVARVLPAAMVFAPSAGGISHAREEDTPEDELAAAIEAFGELANRVLADPPGDGT
jgi:N-carbamoyl-L-amino-acid hydrolase